MPATRWLGKIILQLIGFKLWSAYGENIHQILFALATAVSWLISFNSFVLGMSAMYASLPSRKQPWGHAFSFTDALHDIGQLLAGEKGGLLKQLKLHMFASNDFNCGYWSHLIFAFSLGCKKRKEENFDQWAIWLVWQGSHIWKDALWFSRQVGCWSSLLRLLTVWYCYKLLPL